MMTAPVVPLTPSACEPGNDFRTFILFAVPASRAAVSRGPPSTCTSTFEPPGRFEADVRAVVERRRGLVGVGDRVVALRIEAGDCGGGRRLRVEQRGQARLVGPRVRLDLRLRTTQLADERGVRVQQGRGL